MPRKTKSVPKESAGKGELVLTRVFDAPRAQVWRAWTDPERVKRWWGPEEFTSPSCRIDLRVGGSYLFCMRLRGGKDIWSTGVYREIVPLRRIVCTDCFADEKGNVVPATYYGMDADLPLEMLLTVTFEDHGGKTKLTLKHAGIPAGAHREGAEVGWNMSLDKLARSLQMPEQGGTLESTGRHAATLSLPSDREIVMTRVFDAPRERVFKAYTDPKAIPHWWGPRGFTTKVDRMDVRPGGAWRFVQLGPDGKEHAFHGVYREIAPPGRLVYTFEYEPMPGHVLVDTITFEERPEGRTLITVTSRFETKEDRDGMLQSGMEWGARETMDRLEELLSKEG